MLRTLLKIAPVVVAAVGWARQAKSVAKGGKVSRGKRQADEALEALREPLAGRVGEAMEGHFGPDWLDAGDGEGAPRAPDVQLLLRTILWNWDSVFGADPRMGAVRSDVHLCLEARQRPASLADPMGRRELLLYIEAIGRLADAIGADSSRARQLYVEQEREAAETGVW